MCQTTSSNITSWKELAKMVLVQKHRRRKVRLRKLPPLSRVVGYFLLIYFVYWCYMILPVPLQAWFWTAHDVYVERCDATDSMVARVLNTNKNNNNNNKNDNCLRLATLTSTHTAGLGHKLTEVLFGIQFAASVNATYVYDPTVWKVVGAHGRYPFVHDVFPFQKQYLTTPQVSRCVENPLQVVHGQWRTLSKHSKRQPNACNIYYQTSLNQCCSSSESSMSPYQLCYCTEQVTDLSRGVFAKSKDILRSIYTPTRPAHELYVVDEYHTLLHVAWHVRGGDITLNAHARYFETVAQQLLEVVSHMTHTTQTTPAIAVYFFGQDVQRQFSFLPQVCVSLLLPNHITCYFPETNVPDTLYWLVHADMLITSGSSFSSIAALLKPSGVVWNAPAKEGTYGIYELPEHGRLDSNGRLLEPSINETSQQLTVWLETKKQRKGS